MSDNCRNCGAPHVEAACAYCGTQHGSHGNKPDYCAAWRQAMMQQQHNSKATMGLVSGIQGGLAGLIGWGW